MARLSAHGYELLRVSKEKTNIDPSSSCSWEKETLSIRSDGKILKKLDVVFRSDGQPYSYGWKTYMKLVNKTTKKTNTSENAAIAYAQRVYRNAKANPSIVIGHVHFVATVTPNI